MTELLSPFSRRIIALGLLFLVMVTVINVIAVPLFAAVRNQLDALADARLGVAHLEAVDRVPTPRRTPPVPDDLYIQAPNRELATEALLTIIRSSAQSRKVALDVPGALTLDPAQPAQIAVSLSFAAPEADIEALLHDLETGPPAIRFSQWRMTAPDDPKGNPRFEGRAIAVWSAKP
jgi:hypothetical protein